MRGAIWIYRGGLRRSMRVHPAAVILPVMAAGALGIAALAALAIVVATVVAAVAVVAGAGLVVATLSALGVGTWHIARHAAPWLAGRPRPEITRLPHQHRTALRDESPVDTLRRRYASGEIGQTQFRRQLIDLLKERYVRGDLTMAEYESRVQHVLRDPALRPPV